MTSLKYEKIYRDFLGNITDPTLANLAKNEAYELLSEYLEKSFANPRVNGLFKEIKIDEDVQKISYELKTKDKDGIDEIFVKNVLGKAMAIEWLTPQVNNKLGICQLFTNKEQQFYSQSSHLDSIASLLETLKTELNCLIRDRGYMCNGYLDKDN